MPVVRVTLIEGYDEAPRGRLLDQQVWNDFAAHG